MTDPRLPEQPSLAVRVPTREVACQVAVLDAYDAHHDEVWAFLLDATRDGSVAEDLLQEVFLRLMREARAGRMPELVRPWLYRVAANLAISRGRRLVSARRWFERFGVAEHRAAVAESPERRYLRREAAEDLDLVLASLGADARAALLLSAEGFSGREIADAIGRTEIATRTLLCRARTRVRHELAQTGGAT
jgi:RNA polymerase sigma-70 factor (ECF subfamily)